MGLADPLHGRLLKSGHSSLTIAEVADHGRLMPSDFYGCYRHETCSSEDCSKILSKNSVAWTSVWRY